MIYKKKFAKIVSNKNVKISIIYITFLLIIKIYFIRQAQIVFLFAKKIKILDKYLDFFLIFSKKKVLVLIKITKLNWYTIKLYKN